jgi:hypothetical protein
MLGRIILARCPIPIETEAAHDVQNLPASEPIDGETKFGFIVLGILAVVITIVAIRFLFE